METTETEKVRKAEYAKGYQAGLKRQQKRIDDLLADIRRLRKGSFDQTVEFLITTAEKMLTAAGSMVELRTDDEPGDAQK